MSNLPIELVLIGASGHASDVLGVVEAAGQVSTSIGILVDKEYADDIVRFGEGRNVVFLGAPEHLEQLKARYVIAVGYPQSRQSIHERIRHLVNEAATLVHPSANLGTGVTVGPGSVVLAGACISPLAQIGKHAYVSHLASIGHHTMVGDFASVMPGACISGDVSVGDGALIGTNATVLEKCRIGAGAVVGASALVTKDVPPGVTVLGVPARPVS